MGSIGAELNDSEWIAGKDLAVQYDMPRHTHPATLWLQLLVQN